MPNSTAVLTFDDVKTLPDQIYYLNQECTSAGLATTLYTYIGGIVGIPLLLKTAHLRIPISIEYKIFTGAMVSMAISYFAGVHVKKRCEEKLKKQFAEKLNA